MLKESLNEIFCAAELCIFYVKKDKGCLGYPAAILLLSIADIIGSYFEGNKDFKIKIDDRQRVINGEGFKHFFILNSRYYNLQLSEKSIKNIYYNYRSLLVHNAVTAKGHFIMVNDPLRRPFAEDGLNNLDSGESYPSISLIPFIRVTKWALDKFMNEIDDVVPNSKQVSLIDKKR